MRRRTPQMVVREVVAVADARQVIMLRVSIGILWVVVVGVGQPGRLDLLLENLADSRVKRWRKGS
jgi:hypothetical protein